MMKLYQIYVPYMIERHDLLLGIPASTIAIAKLEMCSIQRLAVSER